jgi:hypothetical protein
MDADTRAAVEGHFAAFNRHDAAALLAGLTDEIVWSTGTDTFRGREALTELFDDWLWSMEPRIDVLRTIVDDGNAAAECVEHLVIEDVVQSFPIGVFFVVRGSLISSVKVFREGTADVDPD